MSARHDNEVASLISERDLMDMLNVAGQTPYGAFLEIGVYQGGSAYALSQIAQYQGRQLHLFDTFSGMPEKSEIDQHQIGDFADTSLEQVQRIIPQAFFHVGVFPDTLPINLGRIAFAHVDCDQYESIKAACILLPSRMVTGGVIYFDDYGCLEGASQAVDEFMPHRIVLKNGKAMVIVA